MYKLRYKINLFHHTKFDEMICKLQNEIRLFATRMNLHANSPEMKFNSLEDIVRRQLESKCCFSNFPCKKRLKN